MDDDTNHKQIGTVPYNFAMIVIQRSIMKVLEVLIFRQREVWKY